MKKIMFTGVLLALTFAIPSDLSIPKHGVPEVKRIAQVGYEQSNFESLPSSWELYAKCDKGNNTLSFADGEMIIEHNQNSGNAGPATYYGSMYLIDKDHVYTDFEFEMTFKLTSYLSDSRWLGVMYHVQNADTRASGYMMNYRVSGSSANSAVVGSDTTTTFNDGAATNKGIKLSDGAYHTLKITMSGNIASHYMDSTLIEQYDVTTKNDKMGSVLESGGFALIVNKETLAIKSVKISHKLPDIINQGFTLVAPTTLDNMIDSDLSTYTFFDWHYTSENHFIRDFGETTEISNIYLLSGSYDHASDYFHENVVFEYSLDGEIYQTIDNPQTGANIFVDCSSSPIQARYLRVTPLYDSPSPYGVVIREFGVNLTTKFTPTITFAGDTAYTYDGESHTPTFEIGKEFFGVEANYHYSSESLGITNQLEAPTEIAWWSLVVETVATDIYASSRSWKTFHIDAPSEKLTPEITFSIENGATFVYDGTQDAPDISVQVSSNATYTTYFELDGVNIGQSIPTTPGTYSFICEVSENDIYLAKRDYRWFKITSPAKTDATITFSSDTYFEYNGETHSPTFEVSPDATYTYQYEKNEQFYSDNAPTEAGTYALVVTVQESDQYNKTTKYVVFTIAYTPNSFLYEWHQLRTAEDGICSYIHTNHLVYDALIEKLSNFSQEEQEWIKNQIDVDDVTIGQTMEYIDSMRALNSGNTTANTNLIFHDDAMEKFLPAILIFVAGIGILAIYSLYMKKKSRFDA